MKILLVGANGKMGKIVQEVCNQKRIEVVLVDKVGQNVKQVFDEECEMCDVMLDFSCPDAFDKNLNFCLKHKMNMIVATTNHSDENLEKMKRACGDIAIFYSPNFSIGFYKFLEAVKKLDDKKFDVAVIEKHHKHKKDNPSGSAKKILEALKCSHENIQCFGVRAGSEIGTHDVMFFCENEQIEIIHKAESRKVFACGAIKACEFLSKKRTGQYYMKDMVEYEK